MKSLVLLTTLVATMALAGPASSNPQATGPCANTRASQVDARIVYDGDVVRCGVGFKILGIGGGIFGPRCPDRKLYYPSHQTCQGEPSVGTYCAPAGILDVSAEDCRCERALLLGTGFLIPTCVCSPSSHDAGHVEDAETHPCHVES